MEACHAHRRDGVQIHRDGRSALLNPRVHTPSSRSTCFLGPTPSLESAGCQCGSVRRASVWYLRPILSLCTRHSLDLPLCSHSETPFLSPQSPSCPTPNSSSCCQYEGVPRSMVATCPYPWDPALNTISHCHARTEAPWGSDPAHVTGHMTLELGSLHTSPVLLCQPAGAENHFPQGGTHFLKRSLERINAHKLLRAAGDRKPQPRVVPRPH